MAAGVGAVGGVVVAGRHRRDGRADGRRGSGGRPCRGSSPPRRPCLGRRRAARRDHASSGRGSAHGTSSPGSRASPSVAIRPGPAHPVADRAADLGQAQRRCRRAPGSATSAASMSVVATSRSAVALDVDHDRPRRARPAWTAATIWSLATSALTKVSGTLGRRIRMPGDRDGARVAFGVARRPAGPPGCGPSRAMYGRLAWYRIASERERRPR